MSAQTNIISDVGTLLKIPTKITTELTDKACLCIGSAISEAKRRGEDTTIVNIGIGTLRYGRDIIPTTWLRDIP